MTTTTITAIARFPTYADVGVSCIGRTVVEEEYPSVSPHARRSRLRAWTRCSKSTQRIEVNRRRALRIINFYKGFRTRARGDTMNDQRAPISPSSGSREPSHPSRLVPVGRIVGQSAYRARRAARYYRCEDCLPPSIFQDRSRHQDRKDDDRTR